MQQQQHCNDSTISSITIYKEHTVKFFEKNLYRYPYPTCQLLKLFPSLSSDIFYKIIWHITRHLDDEDDSEKLRFYNLLANIELSAEKLIKRFGKEVLPLIGNHIKQNRLDNKILWLCTIACEQSEIMEMFVNYYRTDINLSTKSIFIQAISNHKHFLDTLVFDKIPSSSKLLTDCGHIISMAQAISNNVDKSFKRDFNRLEQLFVGSWNKCMYIELCRLQSLHSMLIENIPNVRIDEINCRYNVIDYLCQTIDMNSINFDKFIQPILIENAKYNFQLKLFHPTSKNDANVNTSDTIQSELDLCQQFTAIKLLLQIIQLNHHATDYDTTVKQHIADVKRILQCIDTLPAYIRLLEIIFSLIFLRWEHICHSKRNSRNAYTDDFDVTPNSAASDIDGTENYRQKSERNRYYRHEKYGFMCNADVVDCILKTLKYSATTKKHSEELLNASEKIQTDFFRIYESITDACWRLSLFLTIDNGQSIGQHAPKNLSSMIVQHCDTKNVSGSSDDEVGKTGTSKKTIANSQSSSSLMRRKPRRKQPSLRKSDGDMKSKSLSQSTENERKSAGDVTQISFVGGEKRCIVSKMLGSAEHLVTTCMRKGDINGTKHILKVSETFFYYFSIQ